MRHEDILEELNEVKAQLSSTERDRDHAINEATENNKQINNLEVNNLREDLENADKEKMNSLVKESERKEKWAREEKNEILGHKGNANHGNITTKRVPTKEGSGEGEVYAALPLNVENSETVSNHANEIDILKEDLKQAMEAEETSKRAMDDLAMALKEVATESNQTKENLTLAEDQLQEVKEEANNLKVLLKNNEEKYETLIKESKKEIDRLNNTLNRLRLEAEESLLAFNDKEIQFIKCIKSIEEEKFIIQEELNRSTHSLREAEERTEKSKEENKKLRDILKQALNEANVAKEAASLAQEENSYLKDSLIEKDKALLTLAQETERIRISEAEANETMKNLKRVITSGSKKESSKLERENKQQKNQKEDSTKPSNGFSFDLKQLWPVVPKMTRKSSKDFDEDFDEDDAFGGSRFDLVDSSMKELTNYHTENVSVCEDNLNFDHSDEDAQFDDNENDRNSQGKRKALLRRFGDLLRRKNTHPPKDLHIAPKELAHSPKEIPA